MSSMDIHHDPELFPSPLSFDHERFVQNPHLGKHLVSLNKGPRQCISINLAYAELYLALAVIFRRLGSKEVSLEGDMGQFVLYETDLSDVIVRREGFEGH